MSMMIPPPVIRGTQTGCQRPNFERHAIARKDVAIDSGSCDRYCIRYGATFRGSSSQILEAVIHGIMAYLNFIVESSICSFFSFFSLLRHDILMILVTYKHTKQTSLNVESLCRHLKWVLEVWTYFCGRRCVG